MAETITYPLELETSWRQALSSELEKPYMQKLEEFLKEEERRGETVFPKKQHIFNAFFQTPFDEVKVVILGQDPYHGKGQAHGLCFSVLDDVKLPPSLKNIFKELNSDLEIPIPTHGNLSKWAKQGVLLLNSTLTVREGKPLSHQKKGWEMFTDAVCKILTARDKPIVFLLWGKSAEAKLQCIDKNHLENHLILTAPHPSPLSAYQGFFGCKHFSKANNQLKMWNQEPIKWDLEY